MKNIKHINRNLPSSLMKQSKQINYTKYFDSNWNNIKNTWKGIKTIISITNIYYNYNFSIWGNTFLKKKPWNF